MKERPILFSGPMVRAILEGRKTMTRRVVKTYGDSSVNWVRGPFDGCDFDFIFPNEHDPKHEGDGVLISCPYGNIGDRLWVREQFRIESVATQSPSAIPFEDVGIVYAADGARKNIHREYPSKLSRTCHNNKPSIHMPRWASRIDLEITGVRVERLQDITDSDALAEGACLPDPCATDGCYRSAFEGLWASINGQESWDANPWVWVVEFRPVKNVNE